MRVCERFVRALMVVAVAYGVLSVNTKAQTSPSGASVTVSPTDLSFGVPMGTSPAVSAPQTVTVNIQGQGTVTFTGAGTGNGDFAVNGNSCTGTLTAPTTCQVSVVFTASAAPLNTLESATLTIASNASPATLSVPMNGAYGAIELFGALNINPSLFTGTTWPGNAVSSTTVALSCTASPIVATLSSTPDGNSRVFQDNTIRFVDTPASSNSPVPTSNVCRNGDPNVGGFAFPQGTTNCFQTSYEHDVNNYPGQNPDLAQFPIGQGGPGSFIANYGVPVIDLSALLVSGNQSVTVELDDAGGELGASSLHLVTNCTLAGVVPGGSITGNPVSKDDPTTQTQTFAFDNGGGQNISFTTSTQTAQSAGTVTIPDGTVPIVTDIGIPQQLFSQLVTGSSAAPAVCLRLTGETDSFNAPMCKGYLIQCQDPTTKKISGDNCVPTPSSVRNLLDITRFESPDAAANTNFLGTACDNATGGTDCAPTVINGSNSMLIGPGLLLGSDGWLCKAGENLTTCTSQEFDTKTTNDPQHPVYAAANCILTGSVAGDLCPLDTLTEFLGAADPTHGSTTTGKNSIFVPVVNMPLPFTTFTTMPAINGNGWVNSGNVTVNFTSNAANYSAATPAPNGFTQAAPYSLTYGVAPATTPIPDTTFPIGTDTTKLNPTGANASFGPPLCGANTPLTFGTPAMLSETPGVYNVHYFTTDCAMTEELLFNPTVTQQKDPNANWASFRTLSFGVDTTAPLLTCNLTPTGPNGSHGWYTSNVSVGCNATDELSGFAVMTTPIANTNGPVLQGKLSTTLPTASTSVGAGTANTAAPITAQSIQDLAGNTASQGPYSFPIDEAVPTITAKFNAPGTTFSVGQSVNVTLNCKDTGSGVGSCGGQPVSCPTAPAVGSASFTVNALQIDTTSTSVGPHTLTAVDCAGNVSGSINYTVAFGSAELAIATLTNPPGPVKNGSNLTYKTFVLNIGPNTASNVVVIDTIPSNSTVVSAISGLVSCSMAGCNDLATGSSCSVSANVVTCSTPTIKPILSGLSGFVIKLVVKVSVPKNTTSVTDTAMVSSSNPDPIKGDNTATVTTKVTQ